MTKQRGIMVPLKQARLAKGISQRELGKLLNIQQATLSRAEQLGRPVTPQQAEDLARFFGFPWTEMHFLYPERYMGGNDNRAA
jgi:transcriptional regulator with XRE-family HTH domain